ncbi:hypothetical protein [Streptomyces flavidovirens]|uniref:hypothetical protein n=1 Tax=Streptomyces flavidovirens TaxID=67298 RepID=UPI00369A415C
MSRACWKRPSAVRQTSTWLVRVDSTVARAHHHAAGTTVGAELLDTLEKAVAEEKALRPWDRTPQ